MSIQNSIVAQMSGLGYCWFLSPNAWFSAQSFGGRTQSKPSSNSQHSADPL